MLRYLCISDLHAGARASLLTDLSTDPVAFDQPSTVTNAFALALDRFLAAQPGPKPQLIVLGDVLDLQFSDRKAAYTSALGFLKAIHDTGMIADEVIVTAGNHDHSMWSAARQHYETTHLFGESDHEVKATPAFEKLDGLTCPPIEALMTAAGFKSVDFRYPNLGFASEDRAVFLHHGHFIEDEYRLFSAVIDAMKPAPRTAWTAEDLASENAGWIDFFWSSSGAAAGVGRDAEKFYQRMLTSAGFREISSRGTERIAEILAGTSPMGGRLEVKRALRIAAQVALDATAGRFRDAERFHEVDVLSPGGREGLEWYLKHPAAAQIKKELSAVPDDLTFVFGHTHKPFADRLAIEGYAKPLKIYNTGGWTLNGPRLDSTEGVKLVLIDDDLHTAALHVFGTPTNGEMRPAQVEMLEAAPHFKSELEARLAASAAEWAVLSKAAHDAYVARQKMLLDLTAASYGDAAE